MVAYGDGCARPFWAPERPSATRARFATQRYLPDVVNSVEQLDRLQGALDVVRKEIRSFSLEAIDWFHLKHPPHPVHAELLSGQNQALPGKTRLLLSGLSCAFYALYLTARLVQMRFQNAGWIHQLKKTRYDLILKSWRFFPDGREGNDDFYFGDLARRAADKGLKVLTIYGNPNGKSWKGPKPRVGASPELPEWCAVPLHAPLACAWSALRTSFRLRRFALQTEDSLVRAVTRRACDDCLRPGALPIAVYFFLGTELARWMGSGSCLFLYEGHGWERCLSLGVRHAGLPVRLVGYQHTILLPHQRSLLGRRRENVFNIPPDAVLYLGHRTLQRMAESHPQALGIPFGTFRRLPSEGGTQVQPEPRRRTVLVLPEGHLDETQALFQAALALARRLANHRFVLRCHPVLPFERVRPHLEGDLGAIPNVVLSSGRTIEADFLAASAVLYRGSSAVLFAVRYGLKPFYLDLPGLPEIDPLFELKEWRERGSSPEVLADRLRAYALQLPDQAEPSWRIAVRYVRDYLIPVDERSIQQLLNAVRQP